MNKKTSLHRRLIGLGIALLFAFWGIVISCDALQPGLGDQVDITTPTLSLTSFSCSTGTKDSSSVPYLKGDVTFTGSAADDRSVASVSITYLNAAGSTQSALASIVDGTWTLTLKAGLSSSDAEYGSSLPEGQQSVTITATDTANKNTSIQASFYIDNVAPTVLATSPLTYNSSQPTFYRTIDLKGETYDASPITSVSVRLFNADESATDSKTADGTNTWSVRFDYSAVSLFANNSTCYYSITATDKAGNSNTWFYHRFDVYPLLNAGASGYVTFPSMDEIGKLENAGTGSLQSGLSYAELASIRLGGSATASPAYPDFLFKDTESPSVEWLNLSAANGETPAIGIGVPLVGSILPPSDGSSITASSVIFKLAFYSDMANPWTLPGSSSTLTAVGSSLNFKVVPLNSNGNALPSGHYIVELDYGTNSGLSYQVQQEFDVNNDAPTLTETGVGGVNSPVITSTKTNVAVTLSGFAYNSDDSAADLVYTLNSGADQPVTLGSDNSYSIPVPAPADHSNDGTKVFVLTASNSSGLQTILSRTILVDTTSPVIDISKPAAASWIDGNAAAYTIAGTADDGTGSGTSTVYFIIDHAGVDHSGDTDYTNPSSGWTSCGTGVSWSAVIAPSSFAEGDYVIWINAEDHAGNTSAASLSFGIDRSDPILSESGFAGSANSSAAAYSGSATALFSLSGTASDTNRLASITLAQKAPGTSSYKIIAAMSASLSGTAATWTSDDAGSARLPWNDTSSAAYTSSDLAAGTCDGTWYYLATLTDAAGKTTSLTRTVTVDLTPPTASISLPSSGLLISDTSYTAAGNMNDATSGVQKMYATVTLASAVTPSFSTSSWTEISGASSAPGSSGSWTHTISSAYLESTLGVKEGNFKLWICAVDTVGNVSVSDMRNFTVDLANPQLSESHGANIQSKTPVTFSGTADDAAVSSGREASSIQLVWNVNGGSDTTVSSSGLAWNATSGTWSWTMPSGADGTYLITISATDSVGKTTSVVRSVLLDSTPPSLNVSTPGASESFDTNSITLSGTARDSGGVGFDTAASPTYVPVEYRLSTDGTTFSSTWTALDLNGINWSASGVSIGAVEGTKKVQIRSTDLLGNQTAQEISFYYDKAAPLLAETAVNTTDTIYCNADVVFGGTVSDSNALSSTDALHAYVNGVDQGTISVSAGTWTWTFDADARSDGNYTVGFTAKDEANKTTALARTIAVDKTVPTVTLSTSLSAWQHSTSIALAGTSADTSGTIKSGISKVQYSLDNATWTDLNGTTGWSSTITVPQGASNKLYLKSIDKAGNQSAVTGPLTVKVDTTNPILTETTPVTATQTASALTFTGPISDNLALSSTAPLTLTRKKNGTSLSSVAITPSSGTWTYTQTAAADHSDDGLWELTFTALDKSGLTTVISKSFTIDTTAPEISITSPASGDVLGSSSVSISGTARDTGGVGFDAAMDVEYSLDSTNGTDGTWTAMGSLVSTTSWSASSLDFGSSEGTKSFWIRSTDAVGNQSTLQRSFYYDLAAPTFTETAIASTDTQYTKSTVTYSGAISDSNTSASPTVSVSINSSAAIPITYTGSTWSYVVDASLLSEASYTLVFTAKDAANKTTTLTRTVVVDKTAPSAVIIDYPANGTNTGASFTFTGTASDAMSGVASVQIAFASNGTGAMTTVGTSSWSATVDMAAKLLTEGAKTLYTKVTDKAGNASTWTGVTKSFVYDTAAPVAAITNGTSRNVKAGFTITGTSTDNYGTASLTITQTKDGGSAITVSGTGISGISGSSGTDSWTLSSLPRNPSAPATQDLSDGTYVYTITATDKAGKTSTTSQTVTVIMDKTAPSITITSPASGQTGINALNGASYIFRGSATDAGVGVSKVYYLIDQSATASTDPSGYTSMTAGNGTWSFSDDFDADGSGSDTGRAEGSWYLHVLTEDSSGNVSGSVVTTAFDIDQANPALAETTVNTTSITNRSTGFTLGGTSSDTNGIASITVTQKLDSGTALVISGTDLSGTTSWTLANLPRNPLLPAVQALSDGVYEYVITATDLAGKTSTVTRTIRFDSTGPVLAVTSPAANSWIRSSSTTITGVASDLTAVGAVYYANTALAAPTSNKTLAASWTALGWAAVSGTATNWTVSKTGMTEGSKTIYLCAVDTAGNTSTVTSQSFGVDLTDPILSESSGSNTLYKKANFTYGGSSSDTNFTSLTISVNGGSATTIASASGAWSWILDVDGADNILGNADDLADGTYNLVFTTTDAASRTATISRTVVVDKTAPGITLNAATIALGTGWKNAATHTVGGTASDAGGLDKIQYCLSIDGGATFGSWASLSGTTSFTGSVTFSEGSANVLKVQAIDLAGNTSVATRTIKIDTVKPEFTVTSPDTSTSVPNLNGKSNLAVVLGVTDGTSGPSLAEASLSNTFASVIASTASTSTTPGITIPKTSIAGLSAGAQKIYVRVTDAAGNVSTISSINVVVDKTAPTLTFSSHTDGATVNKTIAMSGTAADANLLVEVQTMVLDPSSVNATAIVAGNYYRILALGTGTDWSALGASSAAVGTTFKALAAGTGTGTANAWVAATSQSGTAASGTYNWSLTGFDTTDAAWTGLTDASAGSGFQIRVAGIATDSAGNTGSVERLLTLDQNSDKPVIKLTNLLTTNTPTLKQSITLYGMISDDDGSVTSLKMKNAAGDALSAVSLDGQSFIYTVAGGDGSKELYFEITDAKGTVFTTAAVASATTPRLYKIYQASDLTSTTNYTIYASGDTNFTLIGAANSNPGTSFTKNATAGTGSGTAYITDDPYLETPLSFKLDTINPAIDPTVSIYSSGAWNDYYSSSAYYGGTASGQIQVRTQATDANGIANVSVSITDVAGTYTAGSFIVGRSYTIVSAGTTSFTAIGAASNTAGTTFTATGIGSGTGTASTAAVTITQGTSFSTPWWTTDAVLDVRSLQDCTASLQITVTDNSGLSSTLSKTITVDNTAPSGSINNPTSLTVVNGDLQLKGIANDDTSGLLSVTYDIGNLDTWTSVSSGTNNWQVNFTGLNTINNYANATYGVDNGDGTWKVPVRITVTDKAGNTYSTGATSYYLNIDPSGDLPRATIVYPYDYAKPVGGTVRVYGSASDDDAVYKVFMQVDSDNDTDWTDETNVAGTDWYNGGLGRQITGTNSWYQNLNTSGEFNPSSGTKTIQVRVRVQDTKTGSSGDVYGPWVQFPMIFDNNVPKIGNTSPLLFSRDTTYGNSGDVPYTYGMYITGSGYLLGSVEDEGSITSILVNGDLTAATGGTNSSYFVANSGNYDLQIPITTSVGTSGDIEFSMTAYDNTATPRETSLNIKFFYDNQSPTGTFTGSTPVTQSNGWYKIRGTALDVGSDIESVAVYLVRRDALADSIDYDRFYNPKTGADIALDAGDLVTVNAGSFSTGSVYTITTVGTTNYVAIGAASNTVGVTFTATGPGSGTGTASYTFPTVSTTALIDVDHKVTETYVDPNGIPHSGDESIANDDGDGIVEKLVQTSGDTYTWYADINSSLLPDGPIEIHYVVIDMSGNATHYVETTTIENNAPVVASITMGTDLDGSGAVGAGETVPITTSGSTTNATTLFTAKSAPMTFDLGVTGGNGSLYYSISGDYTRTSTLLRSGTGGPVGTIELAAAAMSGIADGNRSFTITVQDSTEEYGTGQGLSVIKEITIVIKVTDDMIPSASIAPFYWNSSGSNSLYNSSKDYGHIELTSVTGGAGSDVSGQISIRGTAYDDQRLTSIWMHIDNYAFPIGGGANPNSQTLFAQGGDGQRDDGVDGTYYQLATYSAGAWSGTETSAGTKIWVTDHMSTDGWKFTVTQKSLGQAGHFVTWQLDWNTAKVTGVAAQDIDIRVIAEDKRTSPNPNASQESTSQTPAATVNATALGTGTTYMVASLGTSDFTLAGASANTVGSLFQATGTTTGTGTAYTLTPRYTVDVVPYISEIATPTRIEGGLKEANIRSSSGKYSIIKGSNASFITVTGFNLNPSAARIVNTATLPTATTSSGIAIAYSNVSATYTSLSLSNNVTASGYLEIFTNGMRSINNINDNDAVGQYSGTSPAEMVNREPDLYITMNKVLHDDRYLRFFGMTSTGIKNGYYPDMIMEGDNPVFGYVNLTGGPNSAVGTAAGTGAGTYYPSHAMPQRAKFNGSTGAEVYIEYLIKASIWDQMAMAKDDGNRYIHATVYNRDACNMSILYDRYAELYTNGMGWGSGVTYGGYGGDQSDDGTNNAITIEATNFGNGLLLGRYQYPKLIAKGNSTTGDARVYMLYYDDNTTNRDLIFRNFRIGTTAMANQLYSGGTSSTGTAYAQYTNVADNDTTGRLTAATAASKHFDFGVTAGNIVVVVYYDEAVGRLKLRYSSAAVDGSAPTTAVTWTDSAITFPDYIGNYVSMAIDSAGHIHISAYDSGDSNLSYFYINSYNSATLYSATVDQAFAVGNWTKIKVLENAGNYIPYIAYYNASETGGRDAIKLAYCNTGITTSNVPAGVDTNGYTTGSWEYLTVPALTPPQGGSLSFKQVNLDFNTANKPILGYLGTNLEFGSWLTE